MTVFIVFAHNKAFSMTSSIPVPVDVMTSLAEQVSTTSAPATGIVLNWISMKVLGFSVRETAEVWIIGNAIYQSAPDYARHKKTVLILASVSAGTFLISIAASGTAVVATLAPFVQKPVVKKMIEALEGVTYLIGHNALYKMTMDIVRQAHRTVLGLRKENSELNIGAVEVTAYKNNAYSSKEMQEEPQVRLSLVEADGIGVDEQSDISKKIRSYIYATSLILIVNQLREGVETGLLGGLSVYSGDESYATFSQRIGIAALSISVAVVATSAVIGTVGFGIKKCFSGMNAKKVALGGLVIGGGGAVGCSIALAGKMGHAFAEVIGIDESVGDLTGGDPDSVWSEKRLPMSIPNAFFGYDADPDPLQLICMGFAALRLAVGSTLTIYKVNAEERELAKQREALERRKILRISDIPSEGAEIQCQAEFLGGDCFTAVLKIKGADDICIETIEKANLQTSMDTHM